jgi:catechol 2,3-dioxygenase-like lactoylglutathione lyase family enzyme
MAAVQLRSVAPILQVADLPRAIDFYTKILGFELGWTGGTPPFIASVCRDNVELNLRLELRPVPSRVYIQAGGVDTYSEGIRAAGVPMIHPLEDRDYGMRDFTFADPDGNTIAIGEPCAG